MSDDFAKQQLLNEVKMRAAEIREFVNSLEAAMNARIAAVPKPSLRSKRCGAG